MKIGLKRICSMILLMVLLLGIMPTAAPLEAFAYTEGDISGTTGKGTANDPVICNSFAELKAVLEWNNGSSLFYVRLINLPGGSEVLPDVEREDLWDVAPAITAVGTKVLTVEGTPTFIMKGLNEYQEPDYSSLIQVDGSLHVNGSGTLTLEFHGCVIHESTVFDLTKSTGWLQFDQAVTIRGTVWKDPDDKYTNPICMAVRASAGKLEISGGNFEGHVWDTSYFAISSYRGAVMLSGSVKATITDGTFRGDPVIQAENLFICGLTTELNESGWLKLYGGIFYGIADRDEKPLSRFLASYSAYDYASGHKMVLFDDKTISILDPSQSRTAFSYISSENFLGEWHPTTVLDLGSRLVFENQVPNGSGGVPVYYPGETVSFRFNNMPLNDQLVNRGFTIRRSYEIYELADHTFHQSAADISRHDTVVEFTTYKAATYVMEETLEMILDRKVVSTRYALLPFEVREKAQVDPQLMVTAPSGGKHPGNVTDLNESAFYDIYATWHEVVDGEISKTPMKSTDIFEPGKRYVLDIIATAKEGFWFTAQSICYVNGEAYGLDDLDLSTNTARFRIRFIAGGKAAPVTVCGIELKDGQYIKGGGNTTIYTGTPDQNNPGRDGYAWNDGGTLVLNKFCAGEVKSINSGSNKIDAYLYKKQQGDLRIRVIGSNTLTSIESDNIAYGIYVMDGDLIIEGTSADTLHITVKDGDREYASGKKGIQIVNGNMTLRGARLVVNAGTGIDVNSNNGKITMEAYKSVTDSGKPVFYAPIMGIRGSSVGLKVLENTVFDIHSGTFSITATDYDGKVSNVDALQYKQTYYTDGGSTIIAGDGTSEWIYDANTTYSTEEGDSVYEIDATALKSLQLSDSASCIAIGDVVLEDGQYLKYVDGQPRITTSAPLDNYAYNNNGKLILQNFTYSGNGYITDKATNPSGHMPDRTIVIELEGTNTITNTGKSYGNPWQDFCGSYGIIAQNNLNITGDGSLTITGECGIMFFDNMDVLEGDITINASKCGVYINGDKDAYNTTNYSHPNILRLSGGNLTIVIGSKGSYAYAVNGHGMLQPVEGTLIADASAGWNSNAIHTYGSSSWYVAFDLEKAYSLRTFAGAAAETANEMSFTMNEEIFNSIGYYSYVKITASAEAPIIPMTVRCIGDIDYTVSGSTVTVTHSAPCKMGYLDKNGKYVPLQAIKNSDGSYAFTVPTDVTEVILASQEVTTIWNYNGSWYYIHAGEVATAQTGLTKIDGVWYYLKSGRWASELSQLVKYNNEWWYVVDGKVASSTTALVDLNGEDWYVVKGKIAANTTGLVKVDGVWYYVVKGKVAGNTTTLVKYNGEWFYVVKGKVASDITSMVLYNGEWFYMVKGKLASKTTTLVKHEGKWCYVLNGKLAGKTTTLVKYNGEWFYVINGYVDSQTTGIVVYNGGWYYLVKGKIAAKTTTLVKYGGSWYYVKEGSVDWSYTGNFVYNGKTYKIQKGRVV